MRSFVICVLSIILFISISLPSGSSAQWRPNGLGVSVGPLGEYDTSTIATSDGGAIIVWEDGINDILASKYDSLGYLVWTTAASLNQAGTGISRSKAFSDGADGAIVVWRGRLNLTDEAIFAQRVDGATGTAAWGTETVVISYPEALQPQIIYFDYGSDGEGGLLVAWTYEDYDGSVDADVYVQRVAPDGSLLWTAGGVPVCTEADEQREVSVTSDAAGGALLAWADRRNGVDYDIYAQRINASGNPVWTPATGRSVVTATGHQTQPDIGRMNGTYCLVVWEDFDSGETDIYCVTKYISNGYSYSSVAPVCVATGQQDVPKVVEGKTVIPSAYVLWVDQREAYEYRNLYAQRIQYNHAPQWTLNGIQVTDGPYDEWAYVADSDVTGNLLLSWSESDGTDSDLYVQQYMPDSTEVWDKGGVLVCSAPYGRGSSSAATDGAGGLIMAWSDLRDQYEGNSYDIYVQRIGRRGNWGGFAPRIRAVSDIKNDQGGKLRVSWYRSAEEEILDNGVTQYSLWRRLDDIYSMPAPSGPTEVPGVDEKPDGPVLFRSAAGDVWEWLETVPSGFFEEYAYTAESLYDSMGTDPGLQYFMVRAHSNDPAVFYDSPVVSGYSVDNLSPSSPSGMIAERSFTPEGLSLTWDGNTEKDLHHYNIYRGLSEDFVPGEGNLVASPQDESWFDSEWTWDSDYWYKVSAVDVHGNESAHSVSGPGEITGEDPRPLPEQNFLAQNYPNPFNPRTEISYGLREAAPVTLKIFDVSGRLVKTLVDSGMPAGRHSAHWNGRDDMGNVVSSGVYFYRLSAGDYQRTRKMILLR